MAHRVPTYHCGREVRVNDCVRWRRWFWRSKVGRVSWVYDPTKRSVRDANEWGYRVQFDDGTRQTFDAIYSGKVELIERGGVASASCRCTASSE